MTPRKGGIIVRMMLTISLPKLFADHSDFSTYAKVLGYNKHQFETEYDQTKLSLKDGTLFTLTRENKNEDFVSKTYCLEL